MNDTIVVTILCIVGIIGALVGLGGLAPAGISGGPSLLASAYAAVDGSLLGTRGELLASFDNFVNVHRIALESGEPVRLYDIVRGADENIYWVASDSGLFISRDGGLTWNRFVTSGNEISNQAQVFAITPIGNDGKEFILSVYQNGMGAVYYTKDAMFSLEPLMTFDKEAAYDIYVVADRVYCAMSTGQLIRYTISRDVASVVNVFSSPIVRIIAGTDGFVYFHFGSGALGRADSLISDVEAVRLPKQGWLSLFGGGTADAVEFDARGNLFVLSDNALYISHDSGETFTLFKTIPLTVERIDAFSVQGGVIRVISGARMFESADQGVNWHIQDLPNAFSVRNVYHLGDRIFLAQ